MCLITTRTDVVFCKSTNSPDSEMVRGLEHVGNSSNREVYKYYDSSIDKPSKALPYCVNGAHENPNGCSINAVIFESREIDPSFLATSSNTLPLQVDPDTEPKVVKNHKLSTARSPKGSNSYIYYLIRLKPIIDLYDLWAKLNRA
jgi:hypothetical protein